MGWKILIWCHAVSSTYRRLISPTWNEANTNNNTKKLSLSTILPDSAAQNYKSHSYGFKFAEELGTIYARYNESNMLQRKNTYEWNCGKGLGWTIIKYYSLIRHRTWSNSCTFTGLLAIIIAEDGVDLWVNWICPSHSSSPPPPTPQEEGGGRSILANTWNIMTECRPSKFLHFLISKMKEPFYCLWITITYWSTRSRFIGIERTSVSSFGDYQIVHVYT